jgi:hypothetical protein
MSEVTRVSHAVALTMHMFAWCKYTAASRTVKASESIVTISVSGVELRLSVIEEPPYVDSSIRYI